MSDFHQKTTRKFSMSYSMQDEIQIEPIRKSLMMSDGVNPWAIVRLKKSSDTNRVMGLTENDDEVIFPVYKDSDFGLDDPVV